MTDIGALDRAALGRRVRIAVLVDAYVPRRGLQAVIDDVDHLDVVYAGHPDERDEVAKVGADIVVVGVRLQGEPGAQAIQDLAADGACVLAILGPGMSALTALELGAHASVDGRDSDGSALLDAIERCIRGEHDPVPDTACHEHLSISPREREVLRELANGRTDQEIAGALGISVRTVQSHLDRIREKTRRRRRAELTVLALELGIVPREDVT